MGFGEVVALITEKGFPIVACVAIAWFCVQLIKQYRADIKEMSQEHHEEMSEITRQHKEDMQTMTEAINNNTMMMKEVLNHLEKGQS